MTTSGAPSTSCMTRRVNDSVHTSVPSARKAMPLGNTGSELGDQLAVAGRDVEGEQPARVGVRRLDRSRRAGR